MRLYRADAQSLWYDEGTSVALAGRSLVQIAHNAADDIHPPLYYWLLALWSRLFGNGVVAMRGLSALLGTAVVGGVFALGRRLWGTAVGALAGLLAAISPLLVWYSQEVRMYILATALAVGLMWLTLDLAGESGHGGPAAERPNRRRYFACLLLTTAALFTHYFAGVSTVVAANAIAAMSAMRAWRSSGRVAWPWVTRWVGIQLMAVGLLLPWLAFAWPAMRGWPATSPPFSAGFALRETLATLATGNNVPPAVRAWWPLAAALAALGALSRGRGGERWPAAVVLVWAALPPVLLLIVSWSRPSWNPKFLLTAAPAYELLLGAGIVQAGLVLAQLASSLKRSLATAGLLLGSGAVLVLVAWPRLLALSAMYYDPAYQRDDYRGIARDIAAMAGPDDAVILNAPTQIEVFGYYDRGAHATYPLPTGWAPERDEVWARLGEVGEEHEDLYAVLWAADERDPEGLVEGWLNANRFKAFDRWYGNVRLALWAAPSGTMDIIWSDSQVTFGNEIALASLAHSPLTVSAGNVLTLELGWVALRQPSAEYTVFVQLLDEADHLVAQRDMRPVGGTAQTSSWGQAGGTPADPDTPATGTAVIPDLVGLLIPEDTPPGSYRMIMGLYDGATGTRLPVRLSDGGNSPIPDAYVVGNVRVWRGHARSAP